MSINGLGSATAVDLLNFRTEIVKEFDSQELPSKFDVSSLVKTEVVTSSRFVQEYRLGTEDMQEWYKGEPRTNSSDDIYRKDASVGRWQKTVVLDYEDYISENFSPWLAKLMDMSVSMKKQPWVGLKKCLNNKTTVDYKLNQRTDMNQYDGYAWASSARVNKNGDTQSNYNSSRGTISTDNIIATYNEMNSLKDEEGNPINVTPDTLWCGQNKVGEALQVLNSTFYSAGSAGSQDNGFLRVRGFNLVPIYGLDDADSWGLCDSSIGMATRYVLEEPIYKAFLDQNDFDVFRTGEITAGVTSYEIVLPNIWHATSFNT